MEEIFNDPTPEQQINTLRGEGKSIREIADQLNIPKSTVSDILKRTSDTVRQCPNLSEKTSEVSENLSETVRELPQSAPQGKEDHSPTIEEIKIILKEFQDNLLEKVQSAIEDKIQRAINYYVNNHLDSVLEAKIRGFRQEMEVFDKG
jgi:transposase